MADTKISALTALTGANIATDDEFAIVDTSVTTTKKTTAADLSARTETMTNKTLTSPAIASAVISGTPGSAGILGRDATQGALAYFDNGVLGNVAKVIAAGVGTQALTNSTASDQDYTSMYTFPANSIFTNKIYRVTMIIEMVTGVSSVTTTLYIKIGSTKVFIGNANNQVDSVTRSMVIPFLIHGRAAAGAAAAVSTGTVGNLPANSSQNTVDQPVTLATNGTLTVSLGVTYSGTGSTETLELQSWMIEELN